MGVHGSVGHHTSIGQSYAVRCGSEHGKGDWEMEEMDFRGVICTEGAEEVGWEGERGGGRGKGWRERTVAREVWECVGVLDSRAAEQCGKGGSWTPRERSNSIAEGGLERRGVGYSWT